MTGLFSNPLFAWLAIGLLAIPFIIHLLNRRRHREVPWAAMMFLLAANRKSARRMQLEQWLLLALRTLALVLLPLAMARPLLHSALASGVLADDRHHIVILDSSLSMSAAAARQGPSVFEHQMQRAAELIESLPDGDPITLISAAHPARRLNRQALFNRARARELLAALTQSATHTDLNGAAALIEAVLDQRAGDQDDFTVHLFSDFTPSVLQPPQRVTATPPRAPDPSDARDDDTPTNDSAVQAAADGPTTPAQALNRLADRARLMLYQVGGPTPNNLALAAVELESPLVGVHRPSALRVRVRNHASGRSEPARVELTIDGQVAAELQVPAIDPGAEHTLESAAEFDAVGLHAIEARLKATSGNAIQEDDERRHVLRARERIPVLIVDGKPGATPFEGQAGYVSTALAPNTQLSDRPFIEPLVISETEIGNVQLDRFEVVILCNVRRLPAAHWSALQRSLNAGRGLIVFVGDLVDPGHYNDAAADLLPGRLLDVAQTRVADDLFTRFDPEAIGDPLRAAFAGREKSGVFRARIHQYIRVGRADDMQAGTALLIYDNGDVGIAERRVGQGRCIVSTTTANMEWNNLPAKGDFVTLCMNLLDHAAPFSAAARNLRCGDSLVLRTASTTAAAAAGSRLRTPGGRSLVADVTGSARGFDLNFGRLSTVGLHMLESVRDEGPVAVNVDTAESDLRRLDANEVGQLLDCEHQWIELQAEGGSLARAETSGASSAMLFMMLVLLLCESVAALAFGHTRK